MRSAWLICGGRDFAEGDFLERTLDGLAGVLEPPTLVIGGGATGADALGMRWACRRGIPRRVFVADWAAHGRAAGAVRNQQMLDEGRPDLVVAFPGGFGTADMVRRARNANVGVLEVRRDE